MSFRGAVIEQETEKGKILQHSAGIRDLEDEFLADNPVTLDVSHSGINYKDGLALSGKPGVVRASPLIPGIDVVGTVSSSENDRWAPGDTVILTGAGLGETEHGGLAERARVPAENLVLVPESLGAERAAAIGTAGLTAMLCVLALEDGGITPESGDIVVTGAAGGVGSVAIAILNQLGYRVTAVSGRVDQQGDYLRHLGASDIIHRDEFAEAGKPLQKVRWAGAVDSVGSAPLANVIAQTSEEGVVAACGLAAGTDLPSSVMPFILRGVTLRGINSVTQPASVRERAWERLAADLPIELLDELTEIITLDEVFVQAEKILAGHVRGRTVVRLSE
ncbi:MDR family oxidoreductase [Nesterenkonia populi]